MCKNVMKVKLINYSIYIFINVSHSFWFISAFFIGAQIFAVVKIPAGGLLAGNRFIAGGVKCCADTFYRSLSQAFEKLFWGNVSYLCMSLNHRRVCMMKLHI